MCMYKKIHCLAITSLHYSCLVYPPPPSPTTIRSAQTKCILIYGPLQQYTVVKLNAFQLQSLLFSNYMIIVVSFRAFSIALLQVQGHLCPSMHRHAHSAKDLSRAYSQSNCQFVHFPY